MRTIVMVVFLLLQGCSLVEIGIAYKRSVDHFQPYKLDGRIRVEPGAEVLAQLVLPLLPESVAQVEAEHGQDFPQESVVVYLCATWIVLKSIPRVFIRAGW
jgi:hypothetical protein